MSSPLVLKPLAISKDETVPMIIRLITPPLQSVRLTVAPKNQARQEIKYIEGDENWGPEALGSYNFREPDCLSKKDSALIDFLNYAKDKEFK